MSKLTLHGTAASPKPGFAAVSSCPVDSLPHKWPFRDGIPQKPDNTVDGRTLQEQLADNPEPVSPKPVETRVGQPQDLVLQNKRVFLR